MYKNKIIIDANTGLRDKIKVLSFLLDHWQVIPSR